VQYHGVGHGVCILTLISDRPLLIAEDMPHVALLRKTSHDCSCLPCAQLWQCGLPLAAPHACTIRVCAGVPTTIVGVGASVTIGHGAADGHAYLNWLKMYTHAYIGENLVTAGQTSVWSSASEHRHMCSRQLGFEHRWSHFLTHRQDFHRVALPRQFEVSSCATICLRLSYQYVLSNHYLWLASPCRQECDHRQCGEAWFDIKVLQRVWHAACAIRCRHVSCSLNLLCNYTACRQSNSSAEY
jgi:hypothetical protein